MPAGSSLGFLSNQRHLPLKEDLTMLGGETHGRDGLLRRCRTVVRCSLLPRGNSARTSDSGSCGPTPLASVVGVTDGIWLSLGYEHYDAHLRRLGPSLDVELAW